MAFDPSNLGLQVELNQISSTLHALWETPEQRTRACLLNLVVYCQGTQQLAANTELISKFVRNHACRAILLGDSPAAPVQKTSAWVQAHCHINKAGAHEICSEQITLLAEGLAPATVANMVMANLDYDLPLNLWWQGDLPKNTDSPLWQRVDRLIIDSLDWKNPRQDLQRLSAIRSQFGSRIATADLNWTRTLNLRQAVALSFDNLALLAEIGTINSLEICHAPESKLTALLLASWFAAQLSWVPTQVNPTSLHFRASNGGNIKCKLLETAGDAISSLSVNSDAFSLSLQRETGSCLLHSTLKSAEGPVQSHFPAGNSDLISLLTEEMMPGTRHRVYLKALNSLDHLLA